MLKSEGYMMFRGTARVVPVSDKFPAKDITGDWLYKPEWDCWYVNGRSYPASIVQDIREEESDLKEKLMALMDIVVNEANAQEIKGMLAELFEMVNK